MTAPITSLLARFAGLTALACMLASPAAAALGTGDTAPDFIAVDIDGQSQSIKQYKGKTVVLEWHNPGCPFVKKFYEPGAMQKMQTEAKERGIVWLTINSGAPKKQGHMSPTEARKAFAASKSASTAYIIDETGVIGHLYGAKTTPHMFVIDRSGTIVYNGAVDDKPSTDSVDIESSKNYVTAALDALSAGRSVSEASTKPYGCSVKY
jgi:peroxiredoxin